MIADFILKKKSDFQQQLIRKLLDHGAIDQSQFSRRAFLIFDPKNMMSLANIFSRKLFCWWLLTMIKHLIVSRFLEHLVENSENTRLYFAPASFQLNEIMSHEQNATSHSLQFNSERKATSVRRMTSI